MRRLLVLSLFAGLIAVGATSATAPAASGLCPGAKTTSIPCCGPPTTGAAVAPSAICCGTPSNCCPAAVVCVEQLTIAATPDPSSEGQPVTISGRLFSSSASGATITLWEELPGQSAFKQLAQTTTDSAGNYKFVRGKGSVQVNRSWYVSGSNGARSTTLTEQVRALVKLTNASASTARGKALTLGGVVTPSHTGETVALQERVGKTWKTIGSGRLRRGSKFSLRHSFAHTGSVVLRVMLGGDARNVRSFSRTVKVHVT